MVNVAAKGENIRFNDPNRAVQTSDSTGLDALLCLFENSRSGHGSNRYLSLTHDTRKALIQTLGGLIAVCKHLFLKGFQYVQLREIQSDKIEHEFGVYRGTTGYNQFMSSADVLSAFKKRLAKFSANFLQTLELNEPSPSHSCKNVHFDDACIMEGLSDVKLTGFEEYSAGYVAGWLETKCQDLEFEEEDQVVDDEAKDFIVEVSRGKLTIPHKSTVDLVRAGLCFMKVKKGAICCKKQMESILQVINCFYGFRAAAGRNSCFFGRLSNVLLKGLHNLEKDEVQTSARFYDTAVKKARLS